MFDSPDVKFAIRAVRRAARLVVRIQSELVTSALTKGDRSPVTVADFASQAIVGHLFQRELPDDPLVAEEDSAMLCGDESEALQQVTHFVASELRAASPEQVCAWIDRGNGRPAKRFWTLDPIDGTKGFLRGEQYAVALALLVDSRVELGVLGCPNLVDGSEPEIGGEGSLIVAVRGQGTWTAPLSKDGGTDDFKQLNVSLRAEPSQARVLRSVESGHTDTGKIGEVIEALDVQADPVLMDSQAKYAVLAAGRGDLLFRLLSPKQPDYREKIWDQAAGSIVVEEAGGKITDLAGRPLDFGAGRTLANNRGVMASNGQLHEAALKALAAVSA